MGEEGKRRGVLSDGHGVDGVEIPDYVFGFSDGAVDGGVETVVILWSETEYGDVAVCFCQFVVTN